MSQGAARGPQPAAAPGVAGAERRRQGRRATDRSSDAAPTWRGTLGPAGEAAPGPGSRRDAQPEPSAFQRFFRLFVGARAVIGLALLLAQGAGSALGGRALWPAMTLSASYAVQALLLWLLPRWRGAGVGPTLSVPITAATVGVDVVVFSVLHLLDPASGFNYVALLVLPVLMAAVLTPRVTSLGTAAAAALVLLGGAWRGTLAGGDMAVLMMQAGLAGIGLFVIALLAGELAGRLAREEAAARGSLELARQQAQLNRLVIEQMADGVLVIDRRMRVRAANPAARRLLADQGLAPAAPFELAPVPAWQPLAAAVGDAFEFGGWGEGTREAGLPLPGGGERRLRLRARFTGRRAEDRLAAGEELCVLFLEDLRTVQARTRQEKLAAMGRVSAGIAHEIRNPLAAIAQANALMEEDAATPDQQRLTRIVADNVERLKRIVDDVLEVAPGSAPHARVIDLATEVPALVAEWARAEGLMPGPGSRLRLALPAGAPGPSTDEQPLLLEPAPPLPVRFDLDHLRRVLVNLLDNAQRHASAAPGAVQVLLAHEGAGQVRLEVSSDGPPIPPDVERHLFEPFFSTRSRGTGLGLYICRELCERYGASIDYQWRPADAPGRNAFSMTMPLAADQPAPSTP